MERNKRVLALVQDLFFASRIHETVKKLDYDLEVVDDEEGFLSKLRESKPAVVLLDMEVRGIAWDRLIAEAKANDETEDLPFIAFGSHMDLEKRERALKAGCRQVLARSKFVKNLPQLVERYLK